MVPIVLPFAVLSPMISGPAHFLHTPSSIPPSSREYWHRFQFHCSFCTLMYCFYVLRLNPLF